MNEDFRNGFEKIAGLGSIYRAGVKQTRRAIESGTKAFGQAKTRGAEAFSQAKTRGAEAFGQAKTRGAEAFGQAKTKGKELWDQAYDIGPKELARRGAKSVGAFTGVRQISTARKQLKRNLERNTARNVRDAKRDPFDALGTRVRRFKGEEKVRQRFRSGGKRLATTVGGVGVVGTGGYLASRSKSKEKTQSK